jgi:hypothetical protein
MGTGVVPGNVDGAMTAETLKMLAGVLAPRLGVEPAQLEDMLADHADPSAIVRFVATLVGGCPDCLGEHATCRECGGKGTPGFHQPNAAALVAWISPALGRLGLCIGRPRRDPAGHHNGGGYG